EVRRKTMNVNPSLLIPPFLVLFVIHAIQIGVGILSFTRKVVEVSDYHAWMAIISTGIFIHLIIWMMYFILNREQTDIVDINKNYFGSIVGFLLTILLTVHFILSATVILLTYIVVVQIWMFPELPTWILALAIFVI